MRQGMYLPCQPWCFGASGVVEAPIIDDRSATLRFDPIPQGFHASGFE